MLVCYLGQHKYKGDLVQTTFPQPNTAHKLVGREYNAEGELCTFSLSSLEEGRARKVPSCFYTSSFPLYKMDILGLCMGQQSSTK